MKFGVIYPQNELGHDPNVIRDFVQTVEALGYNHLTAYEHVLGANPDRPGGWQGPYTYKDEFIEPFVLFSYLAALTSKLEFATGILILPQRQTALVAKQAASLDVLCGGRLRLGLGLGWNKVEYVALNGGFHKRGRTIEEQIELLRKLWSQPLVDYQGTWHNIPDAGINPLPLKKTIPLWMGGHAEPVLKRAARLADGWMPGYKSAEDALPALDKLDQYLVGSGRKRSDRSEDGDFGLEVRVPYGGGNPDVWKKLVEGWQEAGSTHLSFNTLNAGLISPEDHIRSIRLFAEMAGIG
ncbi:MAG: LLM class F420-dependent oxidoreductase [Chloroflexi bacterium RBG_16_52_11]|nr:MAG: LLM class F420-dependent oxidoreductase [Chloroflexi bacterium RBG_16_52_11]